MARCSVAGGQAGRRSAAADLESRKRDVLDLFAQSARDFLDGWFENDPIKARVRVRRGGRQLCQPRHAGLGLCPAPPRLRRGERQEGHVGPCDRRHGRDHASDGARRARRRASRSAPTAPVARVLVEEQGRAVAWRRQMARFTARRSSRPIVGPALLFTPTGRSQPTCPPISAARMDRFKTAGRAPSG